METQAIYELVSAHAERARDSIALAAPGRSPMNYLELAGEVRSVGRVLHGLGIGRNEPVAIVLPHGPEIVTACLAVSAYALAVPLDPRSSLQFVESAFSSVDPRAVLVARGARSTALDVAYALGTTVIEADPDPVVAGSLRLVTATSDTGAVPLPAQADDDAFMLSTHGPRDHFAAVALTHHEICAHARDILSELQLTEHDRCLNLTPMWKWRGSMVETIATLLACGSVACVSNCDGTVEFFEWVRECAPTWYTAESAVHEAILSVASANLDVLEHSSIRFVQSAAADLAPDVQVGLERTFNAPVIERALER